MNGGDFDDDPDDALDRAISEAFSDLSPEQQAELERYVVAGLEARVAVVKAEDAADVYEEAMRRARDR